MHRTINLNAESSTVFAMQAPGHRDQALGSQVGPDQALALNPLPTPTVPCSYLGRRRQTIRGIARDRTHVLCSRRGQLELAELIHTPTVTVRLFVDSRLVRLRASTNTSACASRLSTAPEGRFEFI